MAKPKAPGSQGQQRSGDVPPPGAPEGAEAKGSAKVELWKAFLSGGFGAVLTAVLGFTVALKGGWTTKPPADQTHVLPNGSLGQWIVFKTIDWKDGKDVPPRISVIKPVIRIDGIAYPCLPWERTPTKGSNEQPDLAKYRLPPLPFHDRGERQHTLEVVLHVRVEKPKSPAFIPDPNDMGPETRDNAGGATFETIRGKLLFDDDSIGAERPMYLNADPDGTKRAEMLVQFNETNG
jgi:hypothetical protein